MRRISAFTVLFALHAGCSVYDESMVGTELDASGGNIGVGGNATGGVMGSGASASGGIGTGTGGITAGGGSTGNTGGDTGGSATGGDGTGGDSGSGGATGGDGTGGGATGGGSTGGGSGTTYTPVIDSMEDNDKQIGLAGGDYWFTYSANSTTNTTAACTTTPFGTDTPEELSPHRGSSQFGMHFVGVGCSTLKVQGGLGLKKGATAGSLLGYNASAYTGIAFWAKVGSASSAANMIVEIPNGTTHPDGGTCLPDDCYGHYRTSVDLTDQWQRFELKFADFSPAAFGANDGPTMATNALFQIIFSWNNRAQINVWIDDVTFFTQ